MVSIIVPVYNVENYLDQCIKSILNSTFKDFELILVDDGSTDTSSEICDRFAEKHQCVHVIHEEHTGLASARNVGLERSRGEYILFVDGDDVIHPKMIEVLVNSIQCGEYDFSMVYGKKMKEREFGSFLNGNMTDDRDCPCRVLEQELCIRSLYDLSTIQYQVVWNKLYRTSLIGDMTFRQVASEDLDWNSRFFMKMRRAVLTPLELYCYIQRPESIMHQRIGVESINRIKTAINTSASIPANQPLCKAESLKYIYLSFFYFRHQCRRQGLQLFREIKSLGKEMHSQTKCSLLSAKLPLVQKLRLLCFYHIPVLYDMYIGMIERRTANLKKVALH